MWHYVIRASCIDDRNNLYKNANDILICYAICSYSLVYLNIYIPVRFNHIMLKY